MEHVRTNTSNLVSAIELKQLLINLSSYSSNVCFRCRQVGAMWMKQHCQVTSVSGNSVLLFDNAETKYYLVPINSIMQFDLDERFQHYQPHHHYDVQPAPELD